MVDLHLQGKLELDDYITHTMPLKDINVTIPANDTSRLVAMSIFHGFQYFIPLAIFIAGFWLWWKRRKA